MHRLLVIFLANVVLFSTTCFGADIHFCEGEAQSFAILDAAKPCNMHKVKAEKELPPCCKARKEAAERAWEGQPVAKKGKCCYNAQVAFKTDGEQFQSEISFASFASMQSVFFQGEHITVAWNEFSITTPLFRGPPEPSYTYNYQIFFQVFRI